MPTLVLIRHGNTFDKGDTILRVGSRTDIALSTSGVRQVKALADHLLQIFERPAHIFSGALLRQKQTADAINAVYIPSLPITYETSILQEIDYGSDDGLPEEDVIAKHGRAALDDWEQSNILPAGWQANAHQLREGWKTFAASLVSEYRDDAVIFAVTSNGTARFAPQALLAPSAQPEQRKLATASYGILHLQSDGASACRGWNIRPPLSV